MIDEKGLVVGSDTYRVGHTLVCPGDDLRTLFPDLMAEEDVRLCKLQMLRAKPKRAGFEIGAHALRATAATNALDNNADIAKVQEWLGHANISTTRIYDHRKTKPEDSPTFKVSY